MSGKLIERNKEFTYPALLSGLENYIQMMDMMLLFSQEELLDMKKELIKIMGINI